MHFHLDYRTSVHGVRPFEVAHIDHTEADVELKSSRTGAGLGRPWLSQALDAHTRRIVGAYLTYDGPGYRSVMMVLRDIVRRYGRLPDAIVVDGGKEFESYHFLAVTQAYGIQVIRRRGKPQHGSVMERSFGVANTQFFHNLAGNTQVTKNVRQVVKSVNPRNLAEWTLEGLWCAYDTWASELYDTKAHPALGISPREAMERGFAETGLRLQRMVDYDREFLITTCPSVDGGTRCVVPGRGIKVNNVWFNAPALRNANLHRHEIAVRYDPWDPRHAYAFVGGRWEQCVSKYYSLLDGYSEPELKVAFDELKRLHEGTDLYSQPPERIAEWLKNLTPTGSMELFAQRQAENRDLRKSLGMTSVSKFERGNTAEAEKPKATDGETPEASVAQAQPISESATPADAIAPKTGNLKPEPSLVPEPTVLETYDLF